MKDLFAEIDAITAKSTTRTAKLLVICKARIIELTPVADHWQTIDTLLFPIDHGSYRRADEPIWMSDAKGTVKMGRPLRRARDGVIGLFADNYHPTHWQPYMIPAPPKAMEPVP